MRIFILFVWMLVVAELGLPLFAWHFPRETGYIEGFTHKYLAWGRCRIDNTKEAVGRENAWIFLGYVCDENGVSRPHLWVEVGDKVIDHTYRRGSSRKVFAIVDANTMKVVRDSTVGRRDKDLLRWAITYLPAFATADSISGA